MRVLALIAFCALALLALATSAHAYWEANGSGAGAAGTATMPTANQPTTTVTGGSVTVSWAQNSFQGTPLGSYGGGGYTLKRYAQGSSSPVTPNASCATTISGTAATLECVEAGVAGGEWQYTATPVLNSFTGEESPKSTPITVVVAPVNSTLPVISGTAHQGQTLSTTNGTWTNNPTGYSHQWRACDSAGANCTNIAGATSSTHVLTSGQVGKRIRVVVTATNAAGAGTATSNATAAVIVPPTPVNSTAPVISGTPTQGQTLSTTNGTWTNNPTGYSYSWWACDSTGANCANIADATASTYTLTATEVGKRLRVVVTATNAGGSASAVTTATATVR